MSARAPPSEVILHPQLMEVDAGIRGLDARIGKMLEPVAELVRVPDAEAITHTGELAELERGTEFSVADGTVRQKVRADAGFQVRPREAVGLDAEHGGESD